MPDNNPFYLPCTFDPFSIQTVPTSYSWDKGTPALPTGFQDFVTDFNSCTAVSTNEDGIEYVGYAPFVFFSLSSDPGTISDSFLAMRRIVDFGDYYNSETNIVSVPDLSLATFCHVYIMPGIYTITFNQTEYSQTEMVEFKAYGNCIQKHCIDWAFKSLVCPTGEDEIPVESRVTWAATALGQPFEKKWKYEPCETVWASNNGLYIQSLGKEQRIPLAWQWYNFLQTSPNPHNTAIQWLSSGFQNPEQLTWKEAYGPCLDIAVATQAIWKWDLISCSGNPFAKAITWDQTVSTMPGHSTWDEVKDSCRGTIAPMLSSRTITKTKTATVRVIEIPPTAYLTVEQSEERYSPLTVRISARNTISGSFPIDKIVWDLGDGSPLLTQRRWANTLESPFVYSGELQQDYQDPRNYDIIYTYTKTLSSGFTFYPSITAYAANTGTSDSAAAVVGPIRLAPPINKKINLLQNELTDYGKVMIAEIDNNVAVWRADK